MAPIEVFEGGSGGRGGHLPALPHFLGLWEEMREREWERKGKGDAEGKGGERNYTPPVANSWLRHWLASGNPMLPPNRAARGGGLPNATYAAGINGKVEVRGKWYGRRRFSARGVATGVRISVFIPPSPKSAKVNFLWGKNDVRTAIQEFYTPKKRIPPKQISGYAPDSKGNMGTFGGD